MVCLLKKRALLERALNQIIILVLEGTGGLSDRW